MLLVLLGGIDPLEGRAQSVFVFIHANVIDGVTEHVLEDATVIVRDGRIESIQTEATTLPEDAEVIDDEQAADNARAAELGLAYETSTGRAAAPAPGPEGATA